jgi:hypothetical protein
MSNNKKESNETLPLNGRHDNGKSKGGNNNSSKHKGDATSKDKNKGMGHTWGQCNSNAYNKDRPSKKAKSNNETLSHVALATGSSADTMVTAINDPKDTLYPSNGI